MSRDPNPDSKAIGGRIKRKRVKRGLSLGAFAKLIEVAKPTVYGWECGLYTPRPEKLRTIAAEFRCTVDELLGKAA